jgi:hypothetical protein
MWRSASIVICDGQRVSSSLKHFIYQWRPYSGFSTGRREMTSIRHGVSRIGTVPSRTLAADVFNREIRRSFSTAPKSEEMKDEYGALDSAGHSFSVDNFVLESGL